VTYRIVQVGVGNVGRHVLPRILSTPGLELVGVGVRSPEKHGVDAGVLIGIGPVGVVATTSVDELIALKADCVCFMASDTTHGVGRSAGGLVDQMCQYLRSGSNVVTTTMSGYVYPPSIPDGYKTRLAEACASGGTSYLTVGIDPGFVSDALPLLLSGFSGSVSSIHVQETLNYGTYFVDDALFGKLGFGRTPEQEQELSAAGRFAKAWASVPQMIADGLGVDLDGIADSRDVWYTPVALKSAMWSIDAGTVAAIRFTVSGIVGGEPVFTLDHVTRLSADAAPDWPQPPGHGGYRIIVDGVPAMRVDFALDEPGGDANVAALMATGFRAVNAIPMVCESGPGVHSILDLPPLTGRHVFRADAGRVPRTLSRH
jgi:2,4-diaminopentanoate dehydrogenase